MEEEEEEEEEEEQEEEREEEGEIERRSSACIQSPPCRRLRLGALNRAFHECIEGAGAQQGDSARREHDEGGGRRLRVAAQVTHESK